MNMSFLVKARHPVPGLCLWRDQAERQRFSLAFQLRVTRSHPDYAALLVINSYFGVGLTSRLFLSLRESRGLTYSPRSFPRYYGGSVLRGRQEQIFQVYISEVDSIESAHFATRVAMYEFNKLDSGTISRVLSSRIVDSTALSFVDERILNVFFLTRLGRHVPLCCREAMEALSNRPDCNLSEI